MPSAASRRLEPRLPAPPAHRAARRADDRPSLAQFVVLSLLLHAFFILLFGSPSGGSADGRAAWGRLDVTIRGPLLDAGVGRETVARPALPLPGTELLEKRERRREAAKKAAEPPPVQPDLEAPKIAEVPVPAPIAPAAPATPATADLMTAPRIDPVKADVPVIAVPAIEWAPRKAEEPAMAPPVEIAAPRPLPVIPTTTLEATGAGAVAPSLAPPVEIAAPPTPAPLPTISAPSLQPVQVPAAAPVMAPPVELAPIRPYDPPAPAPAIAQPPAGPPAAPDAARPAERVPPREAVRDGGGASRDSPIFNNLRRPPSTAPLPGAEPRIDLEAAKARAREIAREGTGNRALLPFPMPPAPERKTKEQIAIENARKPECKDAYKGLGLLAVVPLIANEFGEGNCRW
ncbi:MAG: hypothetical protein KF738_05190 [Burkholderiales bacterium]|nr:hypothetical protein [Burkholderiales bacterium]